jgi:hypothetical protein
VCEAHADFVHEPLGHAALSAADAQWMEDIMRSVFPDVQSMDDVTMEMFHKVMMVYGHALKDKLPREWTFGGLQVMTATQP